VTVNSGRTIWRMPHYGKGIKQWASRQGIRSEFHASTANLGEFAIILIEPGALIFRPGITRIVIAHIDVMKSPRNLSNGIGAPVI